ncbi:ubiquinol-cytochrome-c reductase complex assembly factor 1 [Diabrotica undecimpunctata]|uniref:ubiquinol-cytochrome-c reductase complex assembly factor 1 n=1 Tax=Diabrotica undecimpunctata TaxID=50387 RepID=UPI003B6380F7
MNITRFIGYNVILKPATVAKLQNNGLKICSNSKLLSIKQTAYLRQSQVKLVSTYEVKNEQKGESFLKKALKKIPFINVDRVKIKARGYILYEEIADKIDYLEFFKEFELLDTFYSWFTVTELHIWMLSLRAMAEGENGKDLRNAIVEALWTDVAQRVKRLGSGSPSMLRNQIVELSEQMQAAFISYDEGIQSDDIVLAGAVWRRFYKMEHADPSNLDKLVKHIRKQVCVLDNLSSENLFKEAPINWLPVKES